MLQFNWYRFNELNIKTLYELLALRSEVFVVEQNCHYLDPDGMDQKALHLLGTENNILVAYLRLFPPIGEQPAIFGRVVTAKSGRNKGYGKKLMQELLAYCQQHFPNTTIECSAQYYLQRFYESFGFQTEGETYDDAGVEHIKMVRHKL